MAVYYKSTVPLMAQTIGYSMLGIAVGPLIWNPLSKVRPLRCLDLLQYYPNP